MSLAVKRLSLELRERVAIARTLVDLASTADGDLSDELGEAYAHVATAWFALAAEVANETKREEAP